MAFVNVAPFAAQGFNNAFTNGSAGRAPLEAIAALNNTFLGGASATQQLTTNAYLQGLMMANSGQNPLFNGTAGINPLGAINALNTMNFGGASSTQQFTTGAFQQGIGQGVAPFGLNANAQAPFLAGGAGVNPLGAIGQLNGTFLGGAASTQQLTVNALQQGLAGSGLPLGGAVPPGIVPAGFGQPSFDIASPQFLAPVQQVQPSIFGFGSFA